MTVCEGSQIPMRSPHSYATRREAEKEAEKAVSMRVNHWRNRVTKTPERPRSATNELRQLAYFPRRLLRLRLPRRPGYAPENAERSNAGLNSVNISVSLGIPSPRLFAIFCRIVSCCWPCQSLVTQVLLSQDMNLFIGRTGVLQRSSFVTFLATEWGWIAFPYGKAFALLDASVVSGWVRTGAKRIAEDQPNLRRRDRSALVGMRAALKRREQNDNSGPARIERPARTVRRPERIRSSVINFAARRGV